MNRLADKNSFEKIVCIIPARGGSKGIPKKNIIPFAGKPLIAWSIEQAKRSRYISDIYVTSDDDDILRISSSYGVKVIRRPKVISGDTASSESALIHALSEIKFKPNLIVFLQAVAPLRKYNDIDCAIKKIFEDRADSLFSGSYLEDFFVWIETEKGLKSLNYDYKNRKRRQETDKSFVENGSIYIFKPVIIEKENNRLGGKISIYEMEFWQSFEIDTYEDIELCEWLFKKHLSEIMPDQMGENNEY